MSLRVDDGRSRGRSKSPGRKDERSRSRDMRAPSPAAAAKHKQSSKKYYSDESDSDTRSRKKSSKKDYRRSESDSDSKSTKKHTSKKRYDSDSDSDPKSKKKSSKNRYSDSDSDPKSKRKSSKKYYDDDSDSSSSSSEDDRMHKHKSSRSKHEAVESRHRREPSPDPRSKASTHKGEYVQTSKSLYAREHKDRHGSYTSEHARPAEYKRHLSGSSVEGDVYRQMSIPGQYAPVQVIAQPAGHRNHAGSIGSRGAEYATVEPYQYATNGSSLPYTQSARPQFIEGKPHSSLHYAASPPSLHRLSVSGGAPGVLSLNAPGQHHGHTQGGLPPGSPLLEAYHGTYQSISPMPSPLMLTSGRDSDLSDIEPLDDLSDDSPGHRSKGKKKVSFYDPEPDALALAAALKHHTPDPKPVIKILPRLSDDHVLMLRTEYKKHMKAQGKGVNIAKHIKMKMTGNLGKVAYAVALGRWESEAHWANFWYQSNTSRRELLIESLMGRSNSEIVKIKEAFSDQRYNNSLEKCMETELKKDKFRNAVLLALEERRMLESEKLSIDLVRRDAEHLYRALTAKEGGETAMIDIIVVRSDRHLAEVLRVFESQYRKNFAREMIQKSRNLVGETLAHILNGVLNRPMRDALLLHQALTETSKDRTDLLVSRLVRFHWEPRHFEKIKVAYKGKYGKRLEDDIEDETKGDFADFCRALCRVES